ncbi:MAG: tol-pal system protein YbgF [Alphaproteobacteria bacterium]|nr:tol-pal system protein YbgF [Alphaproteobacteria bacterium]
MIQVLFDSLRRGCVVLAVAAGCFGALPALAQQSGELRAIIQRINQLEGQLRDVERSVYRADGPPAAGQRPPPVIVREAESATPGPVTQRLTALDDRINGIESEMTKLTGSIEGALIELRGLRDRFDKLVADVDFRLTELERSRGSAAGPGPAPGPAAPPPQTAARDDRLPGQSGVEQARRQSTGTLQPPPGSVPVPVQPARSVLPPGKPDEQYAFARSLLEKLDYAGAQAAFAEFLQKNRDHELAANAHYWLGETFYVRQHYADAASAFLDGYRRFPKAQKAPDSLLKLGLSLASLGDKDQACGSISQLLKDYPNAEAQIRRRAEQEKTRLACR